MPSITLAKAPPPSLWMWLGVLIVISVVGGIFALIMRRRLLDTHKPASELGLLDEARAMVKAGEMSQAEFERMKQVMVARAAGNDLPPMEQMTLPGESRSKPGFDLTGEPLPKSDRPDPPPGPTPDSGSPESL